MNIPLVRGGFLRNWVVIEWVNQSYVAFHFLLDDIHCLLVVIAADRLIPLGFERLWLGVAVVNTFHNVENLSVASLLIPFAKSSYQAAKS